MILPNYRDGSIVNLMSSIAKRFQFASDYQPLDLNLDKKKVILLVLDGLGYNQLTAHPDSFLAKNCARKITSAFPSTTATCITTFLTGFPAQQNAVPGWTVFLKEIGISTTILPFIPRTGGENLGNYFDPKLIFDHDSFFDKISVESHVIQGSQVIDSDFTKVHVGKAKKHSYTNMPEMFEKLKEVVSQDREMYVYCYWPTFDTKSHEFGSESEEVKEHFKELDRHVADFVSTMKDAVLIITADHGMAKTMTQIEAEDFTEFYDCLRLPLTGEPRTAYCYLKPGREDEFTKIVKEQMSEYCDIVPSQQLVDENYFGLGDPNPRLLDRIGDFTLMMKPGTVILNRVPGEKKVPFVSYHGGLTKEEMEVPLILIKK